MPTVSCSVLSLTRTRSTCAKEIELHQKESTNFSFLTNVWVTAFLNNNRGGYQRVKFSVCGPGMNKYEWQTADVNHPSNLPSATGCDDACLINVAAEMWRGY